MRHDPSSNGSRGDHGTCPSYSKERHLWWGNPSKQPLPTLPHPQNVSPLTNFKKYILRRSAVTASVKFPPSFNRRTFEPFTASKAESTPFKAMRFVFLCVIWYTTSALSSNTGKAILVSFSYPVTLTIIQFAFVACYCLLFMTPSIRFTKLRPPTRSIVMTTLPMGVFQIGGHMFSSMAISRIPVSTVHTIKALSPLFTVAAYALLFGVKYSWRTYVSLFPLTVGVMLAFTFDVSASSPTGLFCAFGSAIVFVSQNIFFKKVMPSGCQTTSQRLDKLNLLLYSSSMAFFLMVPIWSFTDLPRLLTAPYNSTQTAHSQGRHPPLHSLAYYFIMNVSANFAQNIIAFVILSSTSPVTYSVASLVKRVWVICMAIIWFNQNIHPVQGLGIILTFSGLFMYNTSRGDVERGEMTMRRVEAMRDMMLPSHSAEDKLLNGSAVPLSRMTTAHVDPPTIATGRARSQIRAETIAFPTNGHLQPRSLRIDTSSSDPSVFAKRATASPTDPYPSPPLSSDSPAPQLDKLEYISSTACSSTPLYSRDHFRVESARAEVSA